MNKVQVLKILKDTLLEINKEEVLKNKKGLGTIVVNYKKTIEKINNDTLSYNEITNSVKAYLEVYNDYDNVLLYKMSDAEDAVAKYLNN